MEKRGYYVDRKYWKDGECRTIYSDNETLSQSDLEQLKANLILAPENTKGRGVFGVDRRFDLCSYYNKSAAELMEHLEIKYYKGRQDREKRGESIYQLNFPKKETTWIAELSDEGSGGWRKSYELLLSKTAADKYECWKPYMPQVNQQKNTFNPHQNDIYK